MQCDARIERDWLERHPVEVAWDLIGCTLRVTRDGATVAGRIVETEAYAGADDPASHAGRLKAARATMAGPPGTLYVYRSYGIHVMLNIVAHEAGQSGAVLIRALEPLAGLDAMRARRGDVPDTRLARGPGSLGQALDIRLTDIGTDLLGSDVFAISPGEVPETVHAGPRIGISRGVEAPWRFFDAASPHVSAHRRGCPVERHEVATLIPPPSAIID